MDIDNVGQHLQRDVNFRAVSSVEMAGEFRKRSDRRALEAWGVGWGGVEIRQWRRANGND